MIVEIIGGVLLFIGLVVFMAADDGGDAFAGILLFLIGVGMIITPMVLLAIVVAIVGISAIAGITWALLPAQRRRFQKWKLARRIHAEHDRQVHDLDMQRLTEQYNALLETPYREQVQRQMAEWDRILKVEKPKRLKKK